MGPKIIGAILRAGSMIVAILAIHYSVRTRKRPDSMCMLAMFATMVGLNLAARAAEAPGSLWIVATFGIILFLFGLTAWCEGLRRFALLTDLAGA